ncbi:MAG: WD40 repeat domain-containing protein [Gemmataceae bacterium]
MRLKNELLHPNKATSLVNLAWSPDGSKVIAGSYRGGQVQIWDVAAASRLSTIDVGDDQVTWHYLLLAPDWSRVYASVSKSDTQPFMKNGVRWYRFECNGKVVAWDTSTGRAVETYQHSPPHHIRFMKLSPAGNYFITFEDLPDEFERRAPEARYLWDAKSKQPRIFAQRRRL